MAMFSFTYSEKRKTALSDGSSPFSAVPSSTVFHQPHCFAINLNISLCLNILHFLWPSKLLEKESSVALVFLKVMNTTTPLNLEEEDI